MRRKQAEDAKEHDFHMVPNSQLKVEPSPSHTNTIANVEIGPGLKAEDHLQLKTEEMAKKKLHSHTVALRLGSDYDYKFNIGDYVEYTNPQNGKFEQRFYIIGSHGGKQFSNPQYNLSYTLDGPKIDFHPTQIYLKLCKIS